MDINDYAKVLLTGKSFKVKKSYELESYLIKKTDELYDKPYTRKGREWGQIYKANYNVIPEYAISKRIPDFIKTEYVAGDRHTYAYDLIHKSGDTFEFKRWKNDDRQNWFSYPNDALNTFREHIDVIKYVICGRIKEYEEHYEVGLHLIADAKTFFDYFYKSQRPDGDPYYNHHHAAKAGKCLFTNVKYEELGYGIQSPISDRASRVRGLADKKITRLPEPQF